MVRRKGDPQDTKPINVWELKNEKNNNVVSRDDTHGVCL
jgi:hypothetical protein